MYNPEGATYMLTTQVISIGDGLGVILPPEVVQKLNVVSGDQIQFIDTPNGIELRRIDEGLADQLRAVNEVMREDDEALRRLAD
jgi:putative addiction module antidote